MYSAIIYLFLLPWFFQNGKAQYLRLKFYRHPDVDLSFEQNVAKYGYPVETYNIITKDNYILKTFRIPHGRNSSTINRKPVLLVHGMAGCAENFIAVGPNKALAYYLADKGYDVWLMNTRGSVFGRKHKNLNPDLHRKFWQFSWHEIAIIDIPANIDFILSQTNQTKLFYVGHSQGTTCYFAMTSVLPEYNQKINLAVQLAPSVFLGQIQNPILKLLSRFNFYLNLVFNLLNINEIFPQNQIIVSVVRLFCSEVTLLGDFCRQVLYAGQFNSNMNNTIMQIIFRKSPAGFSVKQLIHYFQGIDSDTFKQYDYGIVDNLRIYKQKTPPIYDIRKCTAPVAIFNSKTDFLSTKQQIQKLNAELPKLIMYDVPVDNFQHVDFIFAEDVPRLINQPMVELFEKFYDG